MYPAERMVWPTNSLSTPARMRSSELFDDPDFGPVEIRKGNILENRLLVVILADPHHGVDNFIDVRAHIENRVSVSVSEETI
ncbi:MAG: hypothetical protein H6Q42_4764 [Deltaproteobacteria bacterium]|nr:hypothetical protein [Deltaproteobacteria bacterium]